jgi:hypothetical protein
MLTYNSRSQWARDSFRATEGSEFQSRYGQEFSCLHVVQTEPGVYLASNPVRTGSSFPGSKAAEA